ncbi:MAG TPA: mycofactocin-coupled SDR family oxidoreductase [Acidimicrobiales bacterium]|nr:mycofactocin-coupled SDR family oxidoreductase [Acidimicrobiales bacterium]
MGLLDGKVALISGGARGQGRSHALTLAREGCDIAFNDISEPLKTTLYRTATSEDRLETEKMVLETGRRCLAVEADVRDRGAMTSFVERTIDELGKIDIVIANAGMTSFAPVWETPYEMWDETIDICLTGAWNTIRPVLPHLRERKQGNIVLTSSNAGLTPIPNVAPYVAAKHGITGLMKVLAVEMAAFNVRVNSVHPCGVNTTLVMNQPGLDLFAGKEGATFEDAEPGMKSLNLLDVALIQPEDVSNAILYLVSDAARYVTGTALTVDAGTTICPPGSFRGWEA